MTDRQPRFGGAADLVFLRVKNDCYLLSPLMKRS
jgi:hypothetical protein